MTKERSLKFTNPSLLPTTSPFWPTSVAVSQLLITKAKSAKFTILSQLASPGWLQDEVSIVKLSVAMLVQPSSLVDSYVYVPLSV